MDEEQVVRRRRRRDEVEPGEGTELRKRLTGAVILVAVVVLVVPSLLTGRRPSDTEPQPLGTGKTYEIDLGGAPRTGRDDPAQRLPERASQPEQRAPAAEARAPTAAAPSPVTPGVRVAPTGVPAPSEQRTSPPRDQGAPPAVVSAAPAAAVRPPAETSSAGPPAVAGPEPAAWAVQLGAFAGRDTAAKLVADLRARGYAAFIHELRRGGKLLYRVRVGPERDRARAEAIAERLNREGFKASVAAHP